jgi:anti-sigma B factor antagonist
MHDLNAPAQQFEMTVVHKGAGTAATIELSGELDLHSAPILADRLDDLLDWDVTAVHVDGGGLTFVDSSGLKALLDARREAERQGIDFRVVAASDQLRHLVAMTELAELTELLRRG